ncbi:MAG TPA: YceH family protein [Bryobacteraceae bacterium]|nr:YceH family protein [Bryobacteraceae bacterium]
MAEPLNPVELRVLGTLIEKENTTPEYYPMTLNALVAACNQKSNRWPVTEYEESDVLTAIEGLKLRGFAASITGGGRVTKYAQRFTEKLNLGRRETAVICVLALRGPQTLGEIKGRSERTYDWSDLDETETVVRRMIDYSGGPLVQRLDPAPGMKEPRYAQTLAGAVDIASAAAPAHAPGPDRLAALEAEVSQLREEVNELRRRLEAVL